MRYGTTLSSCAHCMREFSASPTCYDQDLNALAAQIISLPLSSFAYGGSATDEQKLQSAKVSPTRSIPGFMSSNNPAAVHDSSCKVKIHFISDGEVLREEEICISDNDDVELPRLAGCIRWIHIPINNIDHVTVDTAYN
jgi:hypothetical protein